MNTLFKILILFVFYHVTAFVELYSSYFTIEIDKCYRLDLSIDRKRKFISTELCVNDEKDYFKKIWDSKDEIAAQVKLINETNPKSVDSWKVFNFSIFNK